jgi:hypothetical protein
VERVARRADTFLMPKPRRFAGLLGIVLALLLSCVSQVAAGREDPLRVLTDRIVSASRPNRTAVLVLFDDDLIEGLRSRLPHEFKVVPFTGPDGPRQDAFLPAQLGQMYSQASAATENCSDVWVVGRRSGSIGRKRAARFADMAAATLRRPVLRDSVRTSHGAVAFSRWLDRPGGSAQRREMRRGQAYADSVLAVGIPERIPNTLPFTLSELAVNPDTLSWYVSKLADTTFYAIGGCSDVEIVFWNASEKLGQLGPGVVPVLVSHIADPNPFVRERVEEALGLATQDERILARTDGEYLKFYDRPTSSPRDIVTEWWGKFSHYWATADSTR